MDIETYVLAKDYTDKKLSLEIGRFLSTWDASTGMPESEPFLPWGEESYTYLTGDYYIVNKLADEFGELNHKPSGTAYDGTASTTEETEFMEIGDVYYYDGAIWLLLQQSNSRLGQKEDIANKVTELTEDSTDTQYPSAKAVYDALEGKVDKVAGKSLSTNDYNNTEKAKVASAYQKPQTGIPKTDLTDSVQTTLTDADTAMRIAMYGKDVTPSADTNFTFTPTANGKAYSVKEANTNISGNIVIPYQYNGKPVTNIANSAFQDCVNITSVIIPKSIKDNGSYIFKRCTSLTSVTLQKGITRIGGESFSGCTSLITIEIPDGVTAIEEYSFNGCTNLTKVIIPDSVADIGAGETQPVFNNSPVTVYCNKGSYAEGYCKRKNKPYICPELTSNKVTSLSAQSTDEQYPTAKAVYDELQNKQNSTDNTLVTTSKQIVGAINEVRQLALGAQRGFVWNNYSDMIADLNQASNNDYNIPDNIYIRTREVPDLWISSIESNSSTYTYTTDEAFTTALQTNGYVQVGYYKLSALETGKVDLSTYYTKTEADNLLDDKLTEPSSGLAVGKYFRVASIDSDGHAVLECVDAPTAPIQSVSYKQIGLTGATLIPDANGCVRLPLAAEGKYGSTRGLLTVASGCGLRLEGIMVGGGALYVEPTNNQSIETRGKTGGVLPAILTNDKIDYIVKRAMTDGVGSAWTDTQRLAALLRMGCTVDENGFVKWTATPSAE